MSTVNSQPLSAQAPGAAEHTRVAPGEIAIGVIIGRLSELFDFFVYG
ncbi:MAG: MFS transporter, partial [Burkholderiales bacterium]